MFAICRIYLMVQSDYVNRNQSRGMYIQGISQFGLCMGKMPLGLIFFCCRQRSIILVLHKLTLRVEEVQKLSSLLKNLCNLDHD